MNIVFKLLTSVHTTLYRLAKGRAFTIGGNALLLTTTGAKSGKTRTTPLMFLPHGDSVLIAASAGGADRHPGWFHNLRKSPTCQVQIGPQVKTMNARIPEGEERDALWQRFIDYDSRFARYQSQTNRVIPVVILSP